MEVSLQFVTHLANDHAASRLVACAESAERFGFNRIWINENVGYRSQMVLLSAIAASSDIPLGTAIMVPYFHHPLDAATALATLGELRAGGQIRVGMARGDVGQSTQHVLASRPVSMVREYATFLKQALTGEPVAYEDFPLLTEHFRLNARGTFQLRFAPPATYAFYAGGNGPMSRRVGAESMDGFLTSGTFLPLMRVGRLATMVSETEEFLRGVSRPPLPRACEVNVSVDTDLDRAFEFPKRQVAHSVLQWERLGFTEEEYERLSTDRDAVLRLRDHFDRGGSVEHAAELVTPEMVRACYLVGTPEEVTAEVEQLIRQATPLGYGEFILAKLGPDYDKAVELLGTATLPHLRDIARAP